MNRKEKKYEAPQLTSVTFKIERGYALSMSFSALANDNHVGENEFMEAERQGYGWTESNDRCWF